MQDEVMKKCLHFDRLEKSVDQLEIATCISVSENRVNINGRDVNLPFTPHHFFATL
jgi:hypothetical protein